MRFESSDEVTRTGAALSHRRHIPMRVAVLSRRRPAEGHVRIAERRRCHVKVEEACEGEVEWEPTKANLRESIDRPLRTDLSYPSNYQKRRIYSIAGLIVQVSQRTRMLSSSMPLHSYAR